MVEIKGKKKLSYSICSLRYKVKQVAALLDMSYVAMTTRTRRLPEKQLAGTCKNSSYLPLIIKTNERHLF